MPRGNNSINNNHRARGGSRGRGRGRGGPPLQDDPTMLVPPMVATTRPPRHPYPHTNTEIDVVIQQWRDTSAKPGTERGGSLNRGNGPWKGGTHKSRSGAGTPMRGTDSPRRGALTPSGRGRGRGRGRGWTPDKRGHAFATQRRPDLDISGRAKGILRKDTPLSDLFYSERPLLRPVKFVRAKLTPFLFQNSEDLLKPAAQVANPTGTSGVLTADRVSHLFRANESTLDSDSDSKDNASDALEEIDFAHLAHIRAEVDAIAQGTATAMMDPDIHKEFIEEVDFADLAAIRAQVDAAELQGVSRYANMKETFTGVYNQIDTTHMSSITHVVQDDQPHDIQQIAPLTRTHDFLRLKPSIGISNPSNQESVSHTLLVEKDPSDALPIEESSLSTTPVTHSTTTATDDILLHSDAPLHDDPHPSFVVDTTPSRPFPGRSASDIILVDRAGHGEMLGDSDQDEELIVYVAPHPRSRLASSSPAIPRVKLPQTSMVTSRAGVGGLRSPVREDDVPAEDQVLSLASLTIEPADVESDSVAPSTRTNAARSAHKKAMRLRRQRERQKKRGRLGFGAYGAIVSEARMKEEDARERRRPRWETRRKGDSDVDWGTADEDEDGGSPNWMEANGMDALSDSLGGMKIDPDLEMDLEAMQGFVKGMNAEGSRFTIMDDVKDEAWLRLEDKEGLGGPDGSSDSVGSDEEAAIDEEEEAFKVAEGILIAESDDDSELSEDSDDDNELSPRSGFQARLRRIRERSCSQQPKLVQEVSDDEEDEDAPEFLPGTRGADDEAFIARISDLLEENSHVLYGRDRKQKKTLFRNLHQGYVDEWDVEAYMDDPEYTTPVNKKWKKGKGKQPKAEWIDPQLATQWAKDRAKKAEKKRERRDAQLRAALDPLSGKGDGVSRKAMRAAARLDPADKLALAPHAVVDMLSLEAQIRRFVEEGGDAGPTSLALPPMDRTVRKWVHEMASAFGVKSVSKGSGAARYTTLIKTRVTRVNEGRVRALMKPYARGKSREGGKDGRRDKGGRMPRHREGDEVGKEAPKIGQGNIGFRMLASMGWSEGDRIGGSASVGIEAPLTAIIKHSKLGLGATR